MKVLFRLWVFIPPRQKNSPNSLSRSLQGQRQKREIAEAKPSGDWVTWREGGGCGRVPSNLPAHPLLFHVSQARGLFRHPDFFLQSAFLLGHFCERGGCTSVCVMSWVSNDVSP